MIATKKKKTKSIGQLTYLTKQVESLQNELILKDVIWLKYVLGFVIVLIIGGFTCLDNRIENKINNTRLELKQDMKDLKQDMKDLKQDMNSRFDKIERAIENINQKLK